MFSHRRIVSFEIQLLMWYLRLKLKLIMLRLMHATHVLRHKEPFENSGECKNARSAIGNSGQAIEENRISNHQGGHSDSSFGIAAHCGIDIERVSNPLQPKQGAEIKVSGQGGQYRCRI